MTTDILSELSLMPAQVGGLAGRLRSRLLNFLMRWEHVEALHACLDVLIRDRPALVSLLDLRVRAYLTQNRPDDALTIMQQRLNIKTSFMARLQLPRIYLAQGNRVAAHQAAKSLTEEQPASPTGWELLTETELALNNIDAAWAAIERLRK